MRDGILGSFRLDENGDMTPGRVVVFRITGGQGNRGLVSDFRGSVVARVLSVPAGLVR